MRKVLAFALSVATLSLIAGVVEAGVMDGIQAYWPMEGNGNDRFGKLNLSPEGKISFSADNGLVGKYVRADGDGSRLTHPKMSTFNVTTAITISVWHRWEKEFTSGRHRIFYSGDKYQYLTIYNRHSKGAHFQCALMKPVQEGTGTRWEAGQDPKIWGEYFNPEQADTWMHWVMVVTPKEMAEWHALETEKEHGEPLVTFEMSAVEIDMNEISTVPLHICWNYQSQNLWVDEVVVWNRALSESEIEELFVLGKSGKPMAVDGGGKLSTVWGWLKER